MKEETLAFYSRMAVFLAGVLGPDYEIDVTDLEKVLVVHHGNISSRQTGAPLLEMEQKLFVNKEYENNGWKISYQGVTPSGKVLRSSSFFIMDEEGQPEGLFCIHFDDLRFKELAERVFHLCHPNSYVQRNIRLTTDRSAEPETFYADLETVTEDIVNQVVLQPDKPASEYTYNEKLEIVRELYKSGVFTLKGAIPAVAERIACSQASMYRYLTVVKEEQN